MQATGAHRLGHAHEGTSGRRACSVEAMRAVQSSVRSEQPSVRLVPPGIRLDLPGRQDPAAARPAPGTLTARRHRPRRDRRPASVHPPHRRSPVATRYRGPHRPRASHGRVSPARRSTRSARSAADSATASIIARYNSAAVVVVREPDEGAARIRIPHRRAFPVEGGQREQPAGTRREARPPRRCDRRPCVQWEQTQPPGERPPRCLRPPTHEPAVVRHAPMLADRPGRGRRHGPCPRSTCCRGGCPDRPRSRTPSAARSTNVS